MKLSRIALLAAALVTVGSSAAMAQNPTPQGAPPAGAPGMGGGRGQMMTQMMFRGITLSADQQAKVDSIMAKYAEQRRAAVADGQGGDREALRGKMREMMEAEGKELRAVLTADQVKVFDANVAEMRERMQNRGGPGR